MFFGDRVFIEKALGTGELRSRNVSVAVAFGKGTRMVGRCGGGKERVPQGSVGGPYMGYFIHLFFSP
jgi:hypothetical protein